MPFALILVFVAQSFGRLALNSSECLIYLSKLEKLQYDERLKIDSYDNKINITFGYQDPLFNNDTFWGLTKDDGKLIDSTCLDLKIWIFRSEKYEEILYNRNPELKFHNNSTDKMRYLSFTVDVAIFQRKLFLESNFSYAYFGVIYYAAKTNQVLKSQHFLFSYYFNPWSKSSLLTNFKPRIQYQKPESSIVGQEDVTTSQKYLSWCTDITCKVYYKPEYFILYEIYVFKQRLSFLEADYIIETNLMYIGNRAKTFIEPLQQIYASNYVILQFSFNLLLTNGTLKSDVIFSSSKKNYSITNYEIIQCIKIDGNSACSDCWDQCNMNDGVVEQQCDCYHDHIEAYSKVLIFIAFYWMVL